MVKYLPKQFEDKWIKRWDKEKLYRTQIGSEKKKQYVLVMFPYPSGDGLHVGHARVYTGTDVLARYFRMKNMNILHPMGWDAFGLPAENAAIKKKTNPINIVPKNIQTFKKQMKMLGFSYDWERELATTDPNYYKWTQWLFIQFFKMGLLYKKNAPINYCPKCKTGLAEEEVLSDGTHERCGNKITKKDLPQWIFAITKYADRLLSDLKGLDWPEGILAMQKNWIGRKEGISIDYQVKDTNEIITCFTTRPDTNFGATFIVIAPEHEFVKKIINGEIKSEKTDVEAIRKYVDEAKSKTELERQAEGRKKTGIFTGFYAINNLNGCELPIYVSDFVLIGFGTGAVVGVPGHDKRDFEFAKEFNLPVLRVVVRKADYLRSYLMGADKIKDRDLEILKIKIVEKIKGNIRKLEIPKESLESYKKLIKDKLSRGFWNEVVGEEVWFLFKFKDGQIKEFVLKESNKNEIAKFCSLLNNDPFDKTSNIWLYLALNDWYRSMIIHEEEEGVIANSQFLNGMKVKEAIKKMMDYLEEKGWGKRVVTYHLRDWIFSRQRYWGEPIPMIYCENCAVNEAKNSKLQYQKYHSKFSIDENVIQANAGWWPISEEDLPLNLPHVKSYEPTETGESPLSKIKEFVNTTCPNCGGPAKRETDTMPNWAGSCWYFLAFAFANESVFNTFDSKSKMLDTWNSNFMKQIHAFLPVDWYIGGAEHAVLHLLYSRFWTKMLYDMGLIGFSEPFLRLRNVGMVLAEDHKKMSKSLGNVINPNDVVQEYGADALRVYEMFMAPFNAEIPWSTRTLQGAYRFLVKVWQIYHSTDKLTDNTEEESKELVVKLQKTIQKVTNDITDVKFNTCISSMMEFINGWSDAYDKNTDLTDSSRQGSSMGKKKKSPMWKLSKINAKKFLQILAPFAPFITEEIWRNVFHEEKSIHTSRWPVVDMSLISEENITIGVQVNGKIRGTVTLLPQEKNDKEIVVKKALSVDKVIKHIGGKKYRVIYVEGRIVNIITSVD